MKEQQQPKTEIDKTGWVEIDPNEDRQLCIDILKLLLEGGHI